MTTVLHELNQLALGGAERVVLNLAAGDRSRRHVVFSWEDGPMRAEFERAGVEVQVGEVELDTDIVHIHTGGEASRLLGVFEPRVPVVETIHSPLRSPMVGTTQVVYSRIVQALHPGSILIHNGMDFTRLAEPLNYEASRRAMGVSRDGEFDWVFTVGWLGRIVPEKNLETLVRAIHHMDGTTRLVLVGPCAPEYREHLRFVASELHVSVHFAGPMQPRTAFPGFDVFFCPSLIEAQGLTRLEAMYLGVPCAWFGDDVGREFSHDGAHATLAPEPTPAAAAVAIAEAMRRHEDQDYTRRAEEWAATFTIERMVAEYGKVYDEILR